MYFVHEVHALQGGSEQAAEAALRTVWAPEVASCPATRLAWCARTLPGSASYPELVTLTAVADAVALGWFSKRLRGGELLKADHAVGEHRRSVVRRILAPLDFSPLRVDVGSIPGEPQDQGLPTLAYIHDFVPPRLGVQRPYERAMGEVLMKQLEKNDELENAMWAGLETVAGGGPSPENVMITRVGSAAAGTRLLTTVITAEYVVPGSWLYDALALRDTWISRMLRTVPWSPLI